MGPTTEARLHPPSHSCGPPAELWEVDKNRARLLAALQALAAGGEAEWPSLGSVVPSLSPMALEGHHAAFEAIMGQALGLRPSPGEAVARDESPEARRSQGSMAALPAAAPQSRARVAPAALRADRTAGSEALRAPPAAVAHARRHAMAPPQQHASALVGYGSSRPEWSWLPLAASSGELPLPPSPTYPTEHEAAGRWESRTGGSETAAFAERGPPENPPHTCDVASPHCEASRLGHHGVIVTREHSGGLPGPEDDGLMLSGPCGLDDILEGLDPTEQGGGPGSSFGWG